MDRGDACLHPYRKRKFFSALAELFNEPPPEIQRLEDFFPAAPAHDATQPSSAGNGAPLDAQPLASGAKQQSYVATSQRSEASARPSQEPEEDSFEYVEFDKSRASLDSTRTGLPSQSSVHDSMQDSLLFLPPGVHHEASVSLSGATDATRFSQDVISDCSHTQPTILSLAASEGHAELVDYYDLDRYCEAVPCWAYENQSCCGLHAEPIRRPMLLFCLQALDEFIASSSSSRMDGALVASCRLARIVFASMWEQDVRKIAMDSDIVLSDYVAEKASIPGVALHVWQIIDSCWRKHKQHFLHHQELYFVEASLSQPSRHVEQWLRVRDLLQVYALRPDLARRLEAEMPPGKISLEAIRPEEFTRGSSHLKSVQFGLAYLHHVHHKSDVGAEVDARRDLLSQSDWKIAFSAIEIHLKQWSRDVQVFPCGAFPRGAAFGSVVDVLVGLPQHGLGDGESPIQAVLKVLSNAKILEREQAYLLSKHRALAMIPFKNTSLILDVKAYRRPQSWFALPYYTGPESFTQSFFSRLLKRRLEELNVVDFDHIYECVVEQLGPSVVASIVSENQLFDLINAEYIPPSQRM